jgi:UDP-N-acetylglucosamine/UDP-N-acetylgalactosamine diphosphorylase
MAALSPELVQRLQDHGQAFIVDWWGRLGETEQQQLLRDLQGIDLAHLRKLYAERDRVFQMPAPEQIQPVPVIRMDADSRDARQRGNAALDRGEVAALVVAGGQGTRLGFDLPKGMYEIGPVSRKSLFQIHAEKVLALSRRHGRSIPLLVMTSLATDTHTREFFQEHGNFGLSSADVFFFRQGTMPALDLANGRLLFESPWRLFSSPNGHGGTLTALAESGLLDRLRGQGIRHVFYFQVDNPLVKVCDAVFLGHHLDAKAEVSSKIVAKTDPTEKVGHLVQVDGRCTIIEYSDMPGALLKEQDASGQLRFWAGSPAIHIFSVDFLSRITQGKVRLPFHIARKKVPHIDEQGKQITPERENALKFEMFVFDALPMADRWTVVEASRAEEFEPLKNASGPNSPESVVRAMSNLAAQWLEKAGVAVPRDPQGHAAFRLEISPLYALDAEELAGKIDQTLRINGPLYLG